MPVNPEAIQKGKCYETEGNQHRRVCAIDVDNDKVTYESWGGGKGNHQGHLSRHTADRKSFADKVKAEIACPTGMKPLP